MMKAHLNGSVWNNTSMEHGTSFSCDMLLSLHCVRWKILKSFSSAQTYAKIMHYHWSCFHDYSRQRNKHVFFLLYRTELPIQTIYLPFVMTSIKFSDILSFLQNTQLVCLAFCADNIIISPAHQGSEFLWRCVCGLVAGERSPKCAIGFGRGEKRVLILQQPKGPNHPMDFSSTKK